MDFEEFFEQYAALSTDAKSKLASCQRLLKRATGNVGLGDIKAGNRDISALGDSLATLAEAYDTLRSAASAFDYKNYMESGDFARQFAACCEAEGIELEGGAGLYEIFPYRVRFDAENSDVYVDKRKVSCLRPTTLAATIKKNRTKLYAAAFNPTQFASELAAAYDTAVLYQQRERPSTRADKDMPLSPLYAYLAPMGRHRREYDRKSYAFDLARLFATPPVDIGDGRKWEFGPSRNNAQAIRVTNQEGKEFFLSTIRFINAD
ncbi:MAG: hypothetical protein LBU58_03920 [Clostridiales bacterium]|nr:hypothetical protein [Clostridiales bacterium]